MTGTHFSLGWSLELGTENGQLDADSCRPKPKQIRFVRRRHADVARRGNSCSVGLRSAPRRTVSETARRCLGLWARLPSHWSHDRSDRTATTSTEPIEKSDRRDRSISIGSRKPYDSPRNQRTTFTPGAPIPDWAGPARAAIRKHQQEASIEALEATASSSRLLTDPASECPSPHRCRRYSLFLSHRRNPESTNADSSRSDRRELSPQRRAACGTVNTSPGISTYSVRIRSMSLDGGASDDAVRETSKRLSFEAVIAVLTSCHHFLARPDDEVPRAVARVRLRIRGRPPPLSRKVRWRIDTVHSMA